MKTKTTILLTLVTLALSSCASIVSKSDYPVSITSPSPTDFKIKNRNSGQIVYNGKAPTVATLSASNGFFSSAKYDIITQKTVQPLNASMDGWYVGNILFGGLIGMLIVDPATGAMWKLPEQVSISN